MKKKRFRAKESKYYYYVYFDDRYLAFETNRTLDIKINYDNTRYSHGNYFRTRKEADLFCDKLNSDIRSTAIYMRYDYEEN